MSDWVAQIQLNNQIDGREILVGSPGYMRSEHISIDEADFERLSGEGKTVTYILADGFGSIALSDIVRKSAQLTVDALRAMNIESYLVKGDNQKAASFVASKLGIEHVFAEVLPEEKALKVGEIHQLGLGYCI